MQIHVFFFKSPPIDITRKYEKLCIVAFNRKFLCDDVIKMKNKCHISSRATTYQNLGENRQYDNFASLCTSQGGMKLDLQLMVFPTMK